MEEQIGEDGSKDYCGNEKTERLSARTEHHILAMVGRYFAYHDIQYDLVCHGEYFNISGTGPRSKVELEKEITDSISDLP